jgi:2'-5' RNA ligase
VRSTRYGVACWRDVARLFVAVWPPPSVVEIIAGLPRAENDGLRWTGPEQWHVTMRFFGEAEIDDAVAACRLVDADTCDLTLGPCVERLGRGVVVAPVHGLNALANAVTSATGHVGRPTEPRAFRGHITLARTKGAVRNSLLGQPVSARWTAMSFALVRSDLHPHGARYTTIATFPLR